MAILSKYSRADIENAREMSSPFPVGLVPVSIEDVQEQTSKSGNAMLVITFKELRNTGASIKEYITDNDWAVRKIKTLEKCFAIPYGASEAAFIGKRGVVRTEEETYNGHKRAKVAGYCKYDENLRYEYYIPQSDSQPVQEPLNRPPPPKFTDDVPF